MIAEGRAHAVAPPWPDKVIRLFEAKYDWNIVDESTYTLLVEIAPRKWLAW